MATIGQALTAPEAGWQRIEDTDSRIQYGTSNVSGDVHYNAGTIKFSFYGTKLRLIYDNNSADTIKVDGVSYAITPSTSVKKALVCEVLNLPLQEHVVEIKTTTGLDWLSQFNAIDIDSTGYLVISIGALLPAPESGWKRYDNSNSAIQFIGSGWAIDTNSGYYQGSAKFTKTPTDSLKFSFIGTKLRIISINDVWSALTATIKIDGVAQVYTQYHNNGNQVLVFEKTGLSQSHHTIEIIASGATSTLNVNLDAIDIDSTGRIYHPDEVTKIEDLTIGKRIRCHYQSTISGTVGIFSDMGREASDFIPVASSATPNGDFYFIMVEDWNRQKRLIADRNIQSSISWDALNSLGIASGSGLPIDILNDNDNLTTIRLPTGGASATDKDNEWDKYIVDSTLNGTITRGDNNVWNYMSGSTRFGSWTSSTESGKSGEKILRPNPGGSGTDPTARGNSLTNSVYPYNGFRPVLLIDSPLLNKSFILFNGEYKKWVEGRPTIEESFSLATPKMTSNITPSGIAFSESYFNVNFEPWKVFNQIDDGEGYASGNGSGGKGFLGYQFPSAVVIAKYVIRSMTGSNHLDKMPKDWYFEGSNDSTNGTDGTWVVLDSRTSQIWTTITTDKEYIISNPQSFKTYRLRWTANNGVATYTDINELMMYSYTPYTPSIPSSWKSISTTLPSVDTFKSEGISDLSILDRKPTTFTFPMDNDGVSGTVLGRGKVFKEKVDLKRFFDVNSLSVK
ncbi:hypothetical protein BSK59_33200 [Paenibacillus odorifer]|uniref:hypothetical protein n=1 Tax=Paenibacillus odorifer TaxID=189426 RepID=UPI0009700DFB|nr:hypothetical protein [Paenibacillus odorifer]OME44718.1 hypothetical protein BSK59_33200 [Paenibacillus odorifer]